MSTNPSHSVQHRNNPQGDTHKQTWIYPAIQRKRHVLLRIQQQGSSFWCISLSYSFYNNLRFCFIKEGCNEANIRQPRNTGSLIACSVVATNLRPVTLREGAMGWRRGP
jgi:hypothetical protein